MNTILSPSNAFYEIENRPTWLLPFVVIGIGTILITWLNLPMIEKIIVTSMPSDLSSEEIEQTLSVARIGQMVGIFFSPIGVLLSWLMYTLLIWLIAQLLNGKAPFKKPFSVVSHSSVITFLGAILSWTILRLRGIDSISGPEDLDVSLGITLLFPQDTLTLPIRMILSNLNLFTVWYLGTLILGVSIVYNFPKKSAAVVVVSVWTIFVAFSIGLSVIGASFI